MIRLLESRFDPYEILAEYQGQQDAGVRHSSGGSAIFIGTMRDFNEDETVQSMFLEHYPGMTQKALLKIEHDAVARWALTDSLVVHRVGEIIPGESIVLVAAWSAHRAEAFEACRYMIDTLKTKAPFWKKETLAKGSRWVEKNT